jgi:hypothetical protein
MASDPTEPHSGRETRLLILVVGVAVIVLLLLAQWRFPGADLSVGAPNAAPLAGLAARATFDEMANTMADVINRVSPLTVAVPLAPAPAEPPPQPVGRSAAATPAPPPDTVPVQPTAWTLALRVRRDVALLYVPTGMRVLDHGTFTVDIVASDPMRQIVLLRVPPSNVPPDTLTAAVRTFPGFAYVAAVSATAVGPTVQPVFVGRSDTEADSRWSHGLVPASVGPGLMPGTLVFSLNSRFVGLVVSGTNGAMVVPAPAVETLLQSLESPGSAVQ